jgi:mRNA degradation ribonuclease J1/J2
VTVDGRSGKPTGQPEIISRGFVGEDQSVLDGARQQLYRGLQNAHAPASAEPSYIQNKSRDILQKYLYQHTKSRPMVIGVVVEV